MGETRRAPVSVVCVSNDVQVLTTCLRRSLLAPSDGSGDTELIVVDNRDGRFASAGAALNHGASLARHDVVAFAHQDVYLHSVAALERAAAMLLADTRIGMLGAVGITAADAVAGAVRDRVVMIGRPAPTGRDVDSLDEVLFLLRRDDVLARPLSEDPDLAWHAYAVEYGARERAVGRRVAAVDLLITHNSMTVNLARLAEAHHRIAALYPELLPLRTTCGVVRDTRDRSRWRTLARRRRGLATWLAESRRAVHLSRAAGVRARDVVLADVRLDVDDALDIVGADALHVVNLASEPTHAWDVDGLDRRGRDVAARWRTEDELAAHLAETDEQPGVALLVTGLAEPALARLSAWTSGGLLVGHAADTGTWALVCPGAERTRALWSGWRSRPFGLPRAGSGDVGRGEQPPRSAVARRRDEVRARLWGLTVGLADLAPAGIRYGYVHPIAGRLLRRPLPVLGPVDGVAFVAGSAVQSGTPSDLTCVLAADHLDVGGVGRVVEMLAEGMGGHGVRPVVLCPGEGQRADQLRGHGIEVVVAPDRATAAAALAAAHPDVVQLHSAPTHLVQAALDGGYRLVPVLHNTEIHYSPAMWSSAAGLFERSAAVVAVSEVVRQFHVAHVPAEAARRITVVANGAVPLPPVTPDLRRRARAALSDAVGARIADDEVVFACLARYDSQKNITGTVTAFLDAVASGARARLVVAGPPSDWLEVRRATAVRDAHPQAAAVHLLGSSDAAALLAAADAFVLDSFFEGWPLATTEAVAAGLPIVVSDTGGASELVERARGGSICVANPTGPASEVDDARARHARRHARRQPNGVELTRAVAELTDVVRRGDVGPRTEDSSFAAMVDGHVRVVRAVACQPVLADLG